MEALWKDLRYGARMLVKNPGFSAIAILTLALGIGANTAVFSIVNAFFFRPLPVKNPGQITVLAFRQKNGPLAGNFSIADCRDLRTQTSAAFADLFGYQLGLDGLAVRSQADRIVTNYVTDNFFPALGIKPALGRLIGPGEGKTAGADPVVVLSYSYWRSRFASDPDIIGRKVLIDGHPITVIGVGPKNFHGLSQVIETQAYLPLGMASLEGYPGDFMENRAIRNVSVMGRLRPDVDLRRAQAVLDVVSRRLSRDHPESEKDISVALFPELRSRPAPDPSNTAAIVATLFLALSALVLLLACVNVANVLLVRATVRQREMAIRVALGAARYSLVRQVLAESVLLGLCGGLAGVLLGYWGSTALSSIHLQIDLPVRFDFGFDWRVFAYALAGALLTGIVVGLVPALRASTGNLNQVLHNGGRGTIEGRNRLRNILVTAQVAGALTILIIAGLFTRSLAAVQRINLGFEPKQVMNFTMDPTEIGYNEAQGRAFFKSVLERVRKLPGVQEASFAVSVPMGYYNNTDDVLIAGQNTAGQPPPSVSYNVITPAYFSTMGVKLLSGRSFTDADNEKSQYTAIVSKNMAEHFWPKQDALGREFRIASDPKHVLRVVGVADAMRFHNITAPVPPFFYLPLWQHYASNSLDTLQIRFSGGSSMLAPTVEHAVRSMAPDLPIFDVKSMTQALYTLNGLLIFQIGAGLAGGLGALGLVLAIVGVYGVISYAATQRTHEIGLRMALGAKPANILQMMIRHGLLIIGAGVVIGLAITAAAAKVVGGYLMISPTDPSTYAAVTLLLTAVALFACFVPARRAMRVDPMVALRDE